MNITSSAGVISLLDEQEAELKSFALKKLNHIVDEFWAEISESIGKIEMLYEEEMFKERELAALVASKVYYHLGSFEDSLTYALGAGKLFDVTSHSEYVETTISKCLDYYTKLRVQNQDSKEENVVRIDPRLEGIVNRMFQRCLEDGKYKQAVGIALEMRRMDVFRKAITMSDDVSGMLQYSLKVALSLIQNKQFRTIVLRELVDIYSRLEIPDYLNVCQCLIFIDDPQTVAEILQKLVNSGTAENLLMTYQIAFDLYESASQEFLQRLIQSLRATNAAALNLPAVSGSTSESKTKELTEPESKNAPDTEQISAQKNNDKPAEAGGESVEMKEDSETTTKEEKKPKEEKPLTEAEKILKGKMTKLMNILGGETTIALNLQFLIRNNHSDLLILKNTKEAVRNSVCHTATVIANSYMHAGTTCDQFLRDNLEWLSRATNWAKFTATASLGVIHKGHESEALNLMSTYLPKDTSPGSAYTEGGGLYALGLIHANHGGKIIEYLLQQLKEATTEMVRHGGCLGLGLAAMGTARQDVYEQLKFNLYQDDAVTGEAAGLAMGLVMLGSKSPTAIEDMVAYAQETQHEKILRGLCIGIPLIMYGRLEESDALIDTLTRDKDPLLRRSGMYTIAMAYCGTGNNKAIKRLLNVAVSDVNDDVRRSAVESIGFLMFRTPEQCLSAVSLLSESYNPHARYGAAMALGIACCGTGLKEAISLLEPMTNDPVNYVRQGALIASALIMIQHTEHTCLKVTQFRSMYSKIVSDKHDDVMAKFGAILALGILDAGGRNVTISLQSHSGHTSMPTVVGLLIFTQFWFWFPMAHFLCLAFTPTSLIGLNSNLEMPKMQFLSNAKPSMFGYTAPLEEKKEKEKEKVQIAILSITAKAAKKKEQDKKDTSGTTESKMEVDEDMGKEKKKEEQPKTDKSAAAATAATTEVEKVEKKEETVEKKIEPNYQLLDNPVRVMRAQLKVMRLPDSARYSSLKPLEFGGIILLKDNSANEKEEIVEYMPAFGPKIDEEAEPEPPEPFEFHEEEND